MNVAELKRLLNVYPDDTEVVFAYFYNNKVGAIAEPIVDATILKVEKDSLGLRIRSAIYSDQHYKEYLVLHSEALETEQTLMPPL